MCVERALRDKQRVEEWQRQAGKCQQCYGTGEVLPSGPSDAPVEFCDCAIGKGLETQYWIAKALEEQ